MPPYHPHVPGPELPRADLRPENETSIILFMAVFSSVALAAVVLRLSSKWMQWAKLAGDDFMLVLAVAQMLAMNILFVIAIKQGGLGRHVGDVSVHELTFFMKIYFVAGLVMPTCYATAKLSILWLLDSIFSFRTFRKVVRILSIVVVCWWIAAILLDTFICFPVHARWKADVKGTCSNSVIQVEYFATPIPWIITDFAILIAPLPSLWALRVSRARQVGLFALFGSGIATCAVACKRYVTLLNIDDKDITFSMVEPAIWTMIESSTTITCAALPASTLALKKIMPTKYLARFIEFLEDQFCVWRDKNMNLQNSRPVSEEVAHVPVEPPATSAPTCRLDLTPI